MKETLTLRIDKVDDAGEDSNPIARMYEDGSGLTAVFDGLGGSGSAKYEMGERVFTGAWFASRLAKSVVAAWFEKKKSQNKNIDLKKEKNELLNVILSALQAAKSELAGEGSKLKSSLIRTFPSTISGLYFEENEQGFKIWALNAGDSRSYILRPDTGLQVLTKDDTVSGADALKSLYGDSRMSNCLHGDEGEIELHVNDYRSESPVIFISASDGCFDYLKFPAHLEHILLHTLLASDSFEMWKEKMDPQFRGIASDDVSLGLIAKGFDSFGEMKDKFQNRLQHLQKKYVEPIEEMERKLIEDDTSNPDLLNQRRKVRESLWEEYKPGYEALLEQKERALE